ncbi:MAG: metalloregulator ArsR/SmtB family transcription factor [Oscillospiraceae bacterium]|nr:metalloregulator ArsR/SmtB family transcription factor [Oscillospiraceae bacterium]
MDNQKLEQVTRLKALADPNRLQILRVLARNENCDCDENCACHLLENANVSQPTLSHHMKILCDCGIVLGCKAGKWMHYRLNRDVINELTAFLDGLWNTNEGCLCKRR